MNTSKSFFKVPTPGMINLDQTQETLLHIYHNLFAIVQSYEPRLFRKDMFFSFRGQDFMIPSTAKDRLSQKDLSPSISSQEAIEVLDLQGRIFRDDRSKDFNGDLMFTQFLEQAAILSRPPGEDLPSDDVSFDQMVDKRKVFFAGQKMGKLPQCDPITAALAIDIDFFLSMQLGLLRMTLKHAFSSTINIKSPKNAQESEAIERAKSRNKTLVRQVGLRGIYKRLLDGRYFGDKPTPNHCCKAI